MLRFVINMDRSKDRLERVKQRLLELGNISFERVTGVDGTKLTDEEYERLTYPIDDKNVRVRFTRALTRGEVGCFSSHKKCWEKLVQSDDNWALILEDDIDISSKASKYMSSDSWIPDGVEICQLSATNRKIEGKIATGSMIKIDEFLSVSNPISPTPIGALAYLISKKAAIRAIELTKKYPAPVDDFLFSRFFDFCKDYKTFRVSPLLVAPNENFKSEIGDRKIQIQKAPFWVRHGIKRYLLDRQVKAYQKNGEPFTFEFLP